MKLKTYKDLRQCVVDAGYGSEIEWSENLKPCQDETDFAREYVWVVLNSGMKNQVARIIMNKVWPALEAGHSASSVFGHAGKCAGIDKVYEDRAKIFSEYVIANDKLAFLEALPWIGPITKYHLAKNLGMDVAKPDRWLQRVADEAGETVESLCNRLSVVTGDRISTVDYVIWRACNLGIWNGV